VTLERFGTSFRYRGRNDQQGSIFSYVRAEKWIPADHPLRAVRSMVDEVLRAMSKEFDKLYAAAGRHSIPPERLLRALLLQCFYSIRSKRMLIEQLNYRWLFRWFVGLDSHGSNFHGQERRNDTHASTTDPGAKLYRKGGGQEARLSYLGHVLLENRNGLIVGAMATEADGFAERDAALLMVHERWQRRQRIKSVGADKGYDTADFVAAMRAMKVRPHVTQNNTKRRSAIDARTTRHAGYTISQKKRPLVERTFGWMKAVAGMRKVKLRGLLNVDWLFVLTAQPSISGGYRN
jgi:Transposase domain (DUF772)/Transposase DDE domain